MQIVICIIVDPELNALLLIKENLHGSFWFPYDAVKPGEARLFTAYQLATKVNWHLFSPHEVNIFHLI